MDSFRDRVAFLLKDRGLTQAEVARRAGFRNAAFLSDIVRGHKQNVSSGNIAALAKALETNERFLLLESEDHGAASEATRVTEGFRPPPQFLGERDLPVYSAVEGGPGAMVVHTDPIEYVQRPWFLREVKEGYAVIVTGESMVPVYEPGDMVIVNPRLPAIRGKNAIFVGGEERGEFTATVKRLERTTVKDWHVRQWNPPDGGSQELVLPKAAWPKALRIVGKYEGG